MLKIYRGSRISPTADSHSSYRPAHAVRLFSKETNFVCHDLIVLLLHPIS
jgi:hypothetical protein